MLSTFADPIQSGFLPQQFEADADAYLRGLRVRLISFGNPSFTGIQAIIKNVRGSTVLDEICRSENILLRTDIGADSLNEVHFEFKSLFLRKDVKFAVELEVTGYTPSESSHLAVVKAWPNPVYGPFQSSALLSPGYFGFIGGRK